MKQKMIFTPLDITKWNRGEVFYYFSKIAPTGYSLTADIDITHMRGILKKRGLKFLPAYIWLTTKLFCEQEEFKIAEKDGQTGYYNVLTPLYAAFHEDTKTFSLMWTEYDDCFTDFYRAYIEDKKQFGENRGILAKKGELPPPNAYTVSCLPWVTFKHFAVHSYDNKPYYFPSVEAGKFFKKDGRTYMPLSLTCHHAATDGWHISRFLERLNEEIMSFEKYF